MKLTEKLQQMLHRKQKKVISSQDLRIQKQIAYIQRLGTPNARFDSIEKRINDRKNRRQV